jgi:hypothetical protein
MRMSHTTENTATTSIIEVQVDRSSSTKDAGRVKFGGACVRFDDGASRTKDSGKVKFGGACVRF